MTIQLSKFTQAFLVLIMTFTSFLTNAQTSYEEGTISYRIIGVANDTDEHKSISNTVSLTEATTVYFPNAFSPDNDGVNDYFGVVGMNAEFYNLKIYNKWGELLFDTSNTNEKWDGTHKGKSVNEGVYVYTMTAKEKYSGKQISRSGTVTLLL